MKPASSIIPIRTEVLDLRAIRPKAIEDREFFKQHGIPAWAVANFLRLSVCRTNSLLLGYTPIPTKHRKRLDELKALVLAGNVVR